MGDSRNRRHQDAKTRAEQPLGFLGVLSDFGSWRERLLLAAGSAVRLAMTGIFATTLQKEKELAMDAENLSRTYLIEKMEVT
jgi:hypothetical protein